MPAAVLVPPQPATNSQVLDKDGIYDVLWRNYFVPVDKMFRTAQYGPLVNAANDSAAAAAGVPVNGFYRNGSIVMVRVT
jgi:hypothetical protein